MSLAAWMDGYVKAWTSNRSEEIADLFTEDAVYDPQTSPERWEGRDAIVDGWQEVEDRPGTWTFGWEPLVEGDGVCVITGRTEYTDDDPRVYRNLWTIRLTGDGRCREFTEWWIEEDW
jgi:ketosteroid isomerase-like protein